MLLLGYDVGSSSVKATLLDGQDGRVLASATSPAVEMPIDAPQPGWAEQSPETWWEHLGKATAAIREKVAVDLKDVKGIGISYQMHGLVLVDKDRSVLRPAIIWCDSRAVDIGNRAFHELGAEYCLGHLLNSPGNFTASKLRWVRENEPALFEKADKMMLPGDYVAMQLTGEVTTTVSGLSEGILWDCKQQQLASKLLEYYEIPESMIPGWVETFSVHGGLTAEAAEQLGLATGTPVSYRAGDQPNNALSLNVLRPGEIAATAGTSGVIYGIGDSPSYDPDSRVNSFVHVNHGPTTPRYGVLLCVNGTGILNSWVHHQVAGDIGYPEMNAAAETVPVGSDGLVILPYGNGAERTLTNRDLGAVVHGLRFNSHRREHLYRAAQEGIVFALSYGLEIMREMGVSISTVRAGDANMFLSSLFGAAFANTAEARVELYNTDGSQGAARGAGVGAGCYGSLDEAFSGLNTTRVIEPSDSAIKSHRQAYQQWRSVQQHCLS